MLTRTSFSMSSGWLAPISITAISVSGVMLSKLSGTPISLFKLPLVAVTLNFRSSTAAIRFLVVVLPFVPVRPSTGSLPSRTWVRCQMARSRKVASGSATLIRRPSSGSSASSLTTAQAAPSSSAFMANWFPSKVSPLRAKNTSPPCIARLSVVTR